MRTSFWDHDVKLLLSRLRPFAAASTEYESLGLYPVGPRHRAHGIGDDILEAALAACLWCWTKVVRPLPGDADNVRTELFREYKFQTFRDAIRFMYEVAPGCDIAIHHPRWENSCKTLVSTSQRGTSTIAFRIETSSWPNISTALTRNSPVPHR